MLKGPGATLDNAVCNHGQWLWGASLSVRPHCQSHSYQKPPPPGGREDTLPHTCMSRLTVSSATVTAEAACKHVVCLCDKHKVIGAITPLFVRWRLKVFFFFKLFKSIILEANPLCFWEKINHIQHFLSNNLSLASCLQSVLRVCIYCLTLGLMTKKISSYRGTRHSYILLFVWKFWENCEDLRGCFLL